MKIRVGLTQKEKDRIQEKLQCESKIKDLKSKINHMRIFSSGGIETKKIMKISDEIDGLFSHLKTEYRIQIKRLEKKMGKPYVWRN